MLSVILLGLLAEQAWGRESPTEFAFEVATGILSIVLFSVTLYAWARRERQQTLFMLSFAFLACFIRQLGSILLVGPLQDELFDSVMDFVILGLFFAALVIRPRRKREPLRNREAPESKN